MSDFNSSLPIRTENNGDVVVKVGDRTLPGQQLAINADGSVNITDNSGSITVDGAVTVSATDLDIRDLAFATDKVDVTNSTVSLSAGTLAALESITVQNGAGGSAVNIQDGGNSITVDGTVELGATTLAALESITVQNGSGASAVNIQDGGNSITVDGAVTVSATDLDIRDLTHVSDSIKVGDGTDLLAINSDGSINVVFQEDPGTEVNDYKDDSAIAASASANHDYTTGAASKLYQVLASASGKMRIEIQVETAAASGTFVTKAVAFNSTANPNINITFQKYIPVASGAKVRIVKNNRDGTAQDLYSTIGLIEG